MDDRFDIIVAGAGPVGLAFALSLRGSGLRVALVDPQPEAALATPGDDGREIALTDGSVQTLSALGAWERIPAERIAPLRRMRVLNGPSDYAMTLGAGGALGRFAPNQCLRQALWESAAASGAATVMAAERVVSVRAGRTESVATLASGRALRATLVVAADTRRSALRDAAGIGAALHDYRQRMLVCPVAHPVPHEATATAWFDYGQTLVTLPMRDEGRSSAVMTVSEREAARLLAMDDAVFGLEATRRYRGRLGPMVPVGARQAVPVVTAYAHRFVLTRFALLGDAAVGMHPTTAHGFNFGLLGQAALAREVLAAARAGRDVAGEAGLKRFERAHRLETGPFFAAAEALMRLYAAGDSGPARLLRAGALRMGNLLPVRTLLEGRMRAPEGGTVQPGDA